MSKIFCIVVKIFIGEKLGYKMNSQTQKKKMCQVAGGHAWVRIW